MHLVVVDPRLLLRALVRRVSAPAQFFALLIYGQVSLLASGHGLDEVDALSGLELEHAESQLARVRDIAEELRQRAIRCKEALEEEFGQMPPDDLLLVTSPPLRVELVDLARGAQELNPDVRPDLVLSQTNLWAGVHLTSLGQSVQYLGEAHPSARQYLIQTAIEAEASSLVTDDEDLLLPGDAAHTDPATRREVTPYRLEDFLVEVLHPGFKMIAVDSTAIARIAADYMGRH